MNEMPGFLQFQINEHTYLKNPESSDLGLRIITHGIDLIDEIGFEHFTFRKLSKRIGSTEASIYRYFESKHKLLLYLTNWYWSWMHYRLTFRLANIESAQERLKRAITLMTEEVVQDNDITHINEVKLYRIVVSESSKAYLTRDVDAENKNGLFKSYKQLVARICDIIMEINADYKYGHMLISTVVEGAHHQRYFAEHLPGLTDVHKDEDAIVKFYTDLVFKVL